MTSMITGRIERQEILSLISIGNSMICSDIWHNDISKLLYVISRDVRRVKFETILKYH